WSSDVCSSDLDWHVWINAVLIEQIDGIDLEPLKRRCGNLFDVLWPTIHAAQTACRSGIKFEAELRCDRHLFTKRSERFAHKFFVCEWAVRFRSVEERYAALYGRANQRDHLLLVCGRAVAKAHSHTAQTERRNFQVAISEFALLHCVSFSFHRSHGDLAPFTSAGDLVER